MSSGVSAPDDKAGRVRELDELNALERLLEPEFQAIAITAAHICDTPIGLVNLIGRDRQYVKGRAGTTMTGEDGAIPFCHDTVVGRKLLEVHDARADPRFRDDPMVTGEPYVRFYAGMPLISAQGHALGTVCVLDHRPRRLDDGQRQGLHTLATHAVTLLELHGRAYQAEEVIRRLEALDKLKEQFLRNVNHELRTPLTSIRSYLELLQEEDLDEGTKQRFLDVIRRNGDRLMHLTDMLLLMASLNAHSAGYAPASVDLGDITRQAVDQAAPAARLKHQELNLHGAEHVPAWADPEQLQTALMEVLDNAVKFTPPGGAIDVTVTADPTPKVEVHDTGMGVEPEDLVHVFEDFYRAPQAEREAVQGAGVGLSIVDKIMTMHGGTVRMESDPDEGACVHLILPDQPRVPDTAPVC
ncbi:GAF domain-containing sensor histidine kinase [Spirillospora albida]|uniref:GAF domain-containing sensor histidine kinase n=1 Tax=Spirillospora albida TaxID=58123 RepID=UPI0004BF8664|nr:GAF domain-containing sensor histidine kinase [Spirillospora albida]